MEEKALLKKLVGIMVSLDLHFVQERAEDGSIVFRLDPYVVFTGLETTLSFLGYLLSPIDAFVTYEGKRASDIPMSKFSVRQMVATAVRCVTGTFFGSLWLSCCAFLA